MTALIRRVTVRGVALALIAGVFGFIVASPSGAATATNPDCTYEWVRSIPQSHQESKYKKEVMTYKTQHWAKYQKHVKGRVEKKTGNSWSDTGTNFDWTKWEGDFWNTSGSFKVRDWADTASPDVIEEGGHNSVSDTYVQNGYTYRWVSESYSYRVIERQTRQVQTGSSFVYYLTGGGSSTTNTDANWTIETPGSPWVKFDERTVQDPPINEGPVRSATEPPRGNYPNVPWTQVGGSEICPGGSTSYTLDCESITLNAPTGVTPTGSEYRYLIDSVVRAVGTHSASAGNHIITLEVLVNETWKQVDSDTVNVAECPDTYICPQGTTWVDSDSDGVVDQGECNSPKKVRGAAKMVDKCRTAGDQFAVRKEKGVVYFADGQRIREGVWLKTGGDRKVVIKAKAASKKFDLVGKSRWVFRFDNRPCGNPEEPPNTGALRSAAMKAFGPLVRFFRVA